jgi:queuosine precursor transporter
VSAKAKLALYIALYTGVIAVSNLLATTFIELPACGLLSVGTITFAATFVLRDWVHEVSVRAGYGRRPVYVMISTAAVFNVFVTSGLMGVEWRIVLASFLAICLAEAADTEVYHRNLRRSWMGRVLRSNAVSAPLDSAIFTVVAFAGVFDWAMIVRIIWGDVLAKFALASGIAFARNLKQMALGQQEIPLVPEAVEAAPGRHPAASIGPP